MAISIPEGFASLAEAASWDPRLECAERAIDSLWLQHAVYALEHALHAPCLSELLLCASTEDFASLDITAMVDVGGSQPVELGALQVCIFHSGPPQGLRASPSELEALRRSLREIERWTRERPAMLRQAPVLADSTERAPLRLSPGMLWGQVAAAIGAAGALAAMEGAQLGLGSKGAGASRGAKSL